MDEGNNSNWDKQFNQWLNPKTGEEIITTELTYTGPVSFKIPERYTFISRNYGASELSKHFPRCHFQIQHKPNPY